MKLVWQSASLLHFWPMPMLIVAVAVACSFVPHTTETVWLPSLSVDGPVNIAGELVKVAIGAPSIDRSISWMPSEVSQVAAIGNMVIDWTAAPFAGDVIFTVGAAAPARPDNPV